jgi:hypothetical protein
MLYMTYDELLEEASNYGLIVKEKPLQGNKGRIFDKKIAIKKDVPTLKEKACILAEELGHYHTTVGNIIDLQNVRNKKQELRARLWAYNNQIGLTGIIRAYEYGCHNLYSMADYLDVTEEFLHDAIKYYRGKYGEYTAVDNYIIYFEPYLGVMKLI